MSIITLGRRPTLGEVCDYYCREDFLDFMLGVLRAYRVVLVAPKNLHWEPDWEQDEVKAETPLELKRFILGKVSTYLRGVGWDERPAYYPSFHQSVWKRMEGDGAAARGRDCVFEADLPTWREAFRDVGAIIALMDEHSVRYRHKFSGRRSLHVVIPAEIAPSGYRGQATLKLAGRLLRWSSAQAHPLPKITRMPYSLNEDTGLVCLPIARGALSGFRPWQANLHLVEVQAATWHEPYDEDDTAATVAFLEALTPSVSPSRTFLVPDVQRIVSAYRGRLAQIQGGGAVGEAWAFLSGMRRLPEAALLAGLGLEDADARWLALEAYLLHGIGLSPASIHRLLAESEEYTRVAAVDVLLRFEDDLFPTLVQMVESLQTYTPTGAQAAYLLTQSDTLRHKVLDALLAATGSSTDALIASACLAGAIGGDWNGAFRILAPLQDGAGLTGRQRVQLAALETMRMMGGWSRHDGAKQAQELFALSVDQADPGAITDLLLLAAGSPSRHLRRDLVTALAAMADPRSVDLLITALADDYTQVRRKAIAALVRIGAPAVDALIAALASDQTRIRRYAVLCLGHIGANVGLSARVKPVILQRLDDGDEVVRRQAVRALRELATEEDVEQLAQFLRKVTTWETSQPATEVLAALGDRGAEALNKLALNEHVFAAAYYIASQGDARGSDILAEMLNGEDAVRRQAAMDLLAELRDPRCVPLLAAELRTLTHWRSMWYAHQLGQIGTLEAVDALIAALSREHTLTRRGAVRGLGLAQDPRAIPHLIYCLSDEDRKTRSEAIKAIVQIGEASIPSLQQALGDESPEGRSRKSGVKQALRRLGV